MKKTVKLIVSGDGGVGKTSFLNRLIHDNFDGNCKLTKGVDFFSKTLTVNGHEYNFVMWDFAGQNQFKQLLTNFVDGSIAAFILFDLSRFNTLENAEQWIQKLNEYGNISAFLLGTKCDMINLHECKVFDKYVSEIINKYNNIIGYLKISSKTGYNVKEAFNSLLKRISN
ncbi:MAG: GTP-binding protein [Candidatus Lokiarchaeota archaeon]|nr:GTP-binding protein [Candidatus Lokiarchaeota archaeon]